MQSKVNFVDRLQAEYSALPGSEQRLADAILSDPAEVCVLTASELSDRAGVSNSTVTRLVHRIGLENYDALRRQARDARRWGSPLFTGGGAQQADDPRFSGDIGDFLEEEMRVLQAGLAALDAQRVSDIARALVGARRLGFAGFRNSHYFAAYARWQFVQFRPHTRLLPGPGESLAESLSDLGPEDMVVVIGVRRVVGRLHRMLHLLAENGVPVLLITDPSVRLPPAATRRTLICPVAGSAPFDSYTGVLALIRYLASLSMRMSGRAGKDHLNKIEAQHRLLEEFE
ncbi:MurR/RpiR family transcriptional regulator [Brevirhabdus sp.]|uniref:MurR/RpiR family transcriptional regulator n=1 Tax=Brevirhabdus sp. TaxID=2004514 RepID=UPI0040581640